MLLKGLYGMGAAPYATAAATDATSAGSSGAAPIPVFACARVSLHTGKYATASYQQVCKAQDYATTVMFQAVAHAINVLFDHSQDKAFIGDFYSPGLAPGFSSLPKRVSDAGITWADESGAIDANTVALYAQIASSGGAPGLFGQPTSVDVPIDQTWLATNALRVFQAIRNLLAQAGVALPALSFDAPVIQTATTQVVQTTAQTSQPTDTTGTPSDDTHDVHDGAGAGTDTGAGGGAGTPSGGYDAAGACLASGGSWSTAANVCIYPDVVGPPPAPPAAFTLPAWAKPALIGVGAGLAFLLLFRKR